MSSNKICLSKEKVNLVVAYTDKNRYIGYKNDLPWKRALSADLRFINKLIRTEPNTTLIMGRRTFESMPKTNDVEMAVITSQDMESDYAKFFKSVEDAMQYCRERGSLIVVFGGSNVYAEAMEYDYRLFCTIVSEENLIGDRVFPEARIWLENISEHVHEFLLSNGVEKTWSFCEDQRVFEENGFSYRFCIGKKEN